MTYDINSYKHDIERFISDLGKLSVVKEFEENNSQLMVQKLQSINSLAQAISAKTAFLRYLEIANSPSDIGLDMRRHKLVPLVQKISYAARHLMYIHHGKFSGKSVEFTKETHSEFIGPDFFEFIPFAIIDNCVKYNFRDGKIRIHARDVGLQIVVDFTSIGPYIEDGEFEKIFELEYRGVNALKTNRTGYGIGLFQAREAIRQSFKGDLKALRDGSGDGFSLNGVKFGSHIFRLELPIS